MTRSRRLSVRSARALPENFLTTRRSLKRFEMLTRSWAIVRASNAVQPMRTFLFLLAFLPSQSAEAAKVEVRTPWQNGTTQQGEQWDSSVCFCSRWLLPEPSPDASPARDLFAVRIGVLAHARLCDSPPNFRNNPYRNLACLSLLVWGRSASFAKFAAPESSRLVCANPRRPRPDQRPCQHDGRQSLARKHDCDSRRNNRSRGLQHQRGNQIC